MAQNPVLYNMGLARPGRSTGTFRGVRAAPQLSDVSTLRNAQTAKYNTAMQAATAGEADRKQTYDALVASLQESVGTARSAYEAKVPTLQGAITSTGEAYKNFVPPDLKIKVPSYTALEETESELMKHMAQAAAATGTGTKWYAEAQGALDTLRAQKAATSAPYKTAYDTAVSTAKSEEAAYRKILEDANTQSKAGYETYAGESSRVRAEMAKEQTALSGLGHLAYASPESDASPSPTSGQQLAATDLYSQDLEAQVLGRKQTQQSRAAPEEDIMSGSMQSSLYRS